MSTTNHCGVNIRGILKNHKRKGSLENVFTNEETGMFLSDGEARQYLHDCLDKGWRVIPTGDCDNFDYQTGCKGHKNESEDKSE